ARRSHRLARRRLAHAQGPRRHEERAAVRGVPRSRRHGRVPVGRALGERLWIVASPLTRGPTPGVAGLPGFRGHASVQDSPPTAGPPFRAPVGGAGGLALTGRPVPHPPCNPARASASALAHLACLALLALLPGCSLRKFAAGSVANSLTQGPDVFGTDGDPELGSDA